MRPEGGIRESQLRGLRQKCYNIPMVKTLAKTSIKTRKAIILLSAASFFALAAILNYIDSNNDTNPAVLTAGNQGHGYVEPNPRGLSVYPDNFRYFIYNNKPQVMATYAAPFGVAGVQSWVGDKNPATQDCYLDLMAEHHLNHFYHLADLRLKPNGQPYPNSPISSKLDYKEEIAWSAGYWAALKEAVSYANQLGITVEIVVMSESTLENKTTGWEYHLFNEANGGPIPANNGFEFFRVSEPELASSQDWSWQNWNWHYQTMLYQKYINELDQYPNVVWNTGWEIDDIQEQEYIDLALLWHDFILNYFAEHETQHHLKAATPTKCLGQGRSKFCSNQDVDFLLIQNKGASAGTLQFAKPVVIGGPWAKKMIDEPEFMREAVLLGLHPSTNLYNEPPGETPGFDYAAELHGFFQTVETWNDEPGAEINENTLP